MSIRFTVFSQQTEAGLNPQLFTMYIRNHYYQIPNNPKGLVAVFPWCSGGVNGYWSYSSNPKFYGLPEDVSHTKQILKMGYAILVMTPIDTKNLCWSLTDSDDKDAIDIIKAFQSNNGLTNKPLYFMGASSGGALMQRIITRNNPIKVSVVLAEVATTALPTMATPPIVWVVMTNADEQTAANANLDLMVQFGHPGAVVISPKRQVTPAFFSEQMAVINATQSAQMANALLEIGLIDSIGNLLNDPKTYNWKDALNQKCPWLLNSPATTLKTTQSSGILQALQAAYASHESTAMDTTAILKWFEDGTPGNFSVYAEKYAVTKPAYFSLVDTTDTAINDISIAALGLRLSPNLLNEKSIIQYTLSHTENVSINVCSSTGLTIQNIVCEKQQAGTYKVEWNTSSLKGGLYIVVMTTSEGNKAAIGIKTNSPF